MSTISGDAGGRLHLIELVPPDSRANGKDLLARLDALLREIGAAIVESVWAAQSLEGRVP